MEAQEIIVRQIAENQRQTSIEVAADKDLHAKPVIKQYVPPLMSDEDEAAAKVEGERLVRLTQAIIESMIEKGQLKKL